MRRLLILPALCLLFAVGARADDCEYSEPRDIDIELDGATRARIEATAGFLHIRGQKGLDRVEVRGTACAERRSDLEIVHLTVDRRGDEIRILAKIDDHGSWHNGPWLDLTIAVPGDLALEVRDGSGEIEAFDIGSIDLEDGSGEVVLERVHGDVRIEDGSGALDVRDVDGMVLVANDGSGEITIRGARRDVEIRRDGSGGIDISDVDGNVWIGSDGSGSIRAAHVAGDFLVRNDGSGGISFAAIGGRVEVP
jgi:hypothetical protein